MGERVIMTRLVRGRAPGREFDIAFWQALGPRRILEAAWDLVVTAAATQGVHEDQLRLPRSVTRLERGRRPLPDHGGLRGDDAHGTAVHHRIWTSGLNPLSRMHGNYFLHWPRLAHLPKTSIQAILPSRSVFFPIGIGPVRIDIMTSVSGLEFAPARERKVRAEFGGQPAPVLCRADLFRSKMAAGRIRDRWPLSEQNRVCFPPMTSNRQN